MKSPDHLLGIDGIDEGMATWTFTCVHPVGLDRWRYRMPDGAIDPNSDASECWLASWWDALGSELLDIAGPVNCLPIPVKPHPHWDYDNGGAIVFDSGEDES